jgi:hypothetical protein
MLVWNMKFMFKRGVKARLSHYMYHKSEKEINLFSFFSGNKGTGRRLASSGMLRRVALVRTDDSEELSASIIRVIRIGELGTTLAVTNNRCGSCMNWRFGGTYLLHHQGGRNRWTSNNVSLTSNRCRLLVRLTLFLVHRFLPPWWWRR